MAPPLRCEIERLKALGPDECCSGACMNAQGVVVGYSGVPTTDLWNPVSHAVLWAAGIPRDLGTLPGFSISFAKGINDAGEVIGNAVRLDAQSRPNNHAFLYVNGVMRELGTLGGWSSGATGINDAGWVVGGAETSSGAHHAFLWRDGTMHDLGTLGGRASTAFGINDAGEIVGEAQTRTGQTHGCLWRNGRIQDLGEYVARGIGKSGLICGHRETRWGGRIGLFRDSRWISLGRLGGMEAYAAHVNDFGQVVGSSDVWRFDDYGGFQSHGCLYSGTMRDLNKLTPKTPDAAIVSAEFIDNNGVILATLRIEARAGRPNRSEGCILRPLGGGAHSIV